MRPRLIRWSDGGGQSERSSRRSHVARNDNPNYDYD